MEREQGIVGVYDDHLKAVKAIQTLEQNDFPLDHVSFIGDHEKIKEVTDAKTWADLTKQGAKVGTVAGGVFGALVGLSLIPIPGIIVFAGGAISATLGALSGALTGGLGGSIVGTALGVEIGSEGKIEGEGEEIDLKAYDDEIKAGKYLIVIRGNAKDIEWAHQILKQETEYKHVRSFSLAF